MNMNEQHKDETERMMSEEYGKEFGGCLAFLVCSAAVLGIFILAAIIKIFS